MRPVAAGRLQPGVRDEDRVRSAVRFQHAQRAAEPGWQRMLQSARAPQQLHVALRFQAFDEPCAPFRAIETALREDLDTLSRAQPIEQPHHAPDLSLAVLASVAHERVR
ncbi:MAG: hypothetical protein U5Q44_06100 [Dehalococcoidia bacterium]|nr:hypothetical protein [Dehalococcoidia bacterium]